MPFHERVLRRAKRLPRVGLAISPFHTVVIWASPLCREGDTRVARIPSGEMLLRRPSRCRPRCDRSRRRERAVGAGAGAAIRSTHGEKRHRRIGLTPRAMTLREPSRRADHRGLPQRDAEAGLVGARRRPCRPTRCSGAMYATEPPPRRPRAIVSREPEVADEQARRPARRRRCRA